MSFQPLSFWRKRRPTSAPAPPESRVDAEIESFVALLTEEKIAAGHSPEAARRAALVEAGGVPQIKEAIQDVHPWAPLDRLCQDLTYGLRLFRRAPALNLAIVCTLALGIGATAATFSVVDAVLLRPLPYADADRLVVLLHREKNPVSPANFLDWQRDARGFSAMGAAEYWTPILGVPGGAEKLFALRVSSEILPMLGVAPAIGRFASAGTDAAREVVIAHGLWRRAFGGDSAVLGREVLLDGVAHVVVGVMPPDFIFAPFWATRAELWAALDLGTRATQRGGNSLRVFARLAPTVTLDHARASLDALTSDLEARFPGSNRNVTVTPLKDKVVGDARQSIVVLFAAVGLVLLIACANVAHMLLARAAMREREVSVRAALGASRPRLIRQFLTESLLLAIAGGAGGFALAGGAIALLRQLGEGSIPRAQSIALDGHIAAFAAALSVLTMIVFGLAPALRMSRPDLTMALRDGERGSSTGRRSRRVRDVLIASEVALAITLLVGAALLIRSFVALRAVDPGWAPDRLVSMVVSVTGSPEGAPGRRFDFYQTVLERVRALPGVESAGAINHVPLTGDIWGWPFTVEGRPVPQPADIPTAAFRVVMPRYFSTMGLALERGRDFADGDRAGAQPTVIVNRFMADTHWPGEDAVGKRIRLGGAASTSPWLTIVGVARNAVRATWQDVPEEELYLPLLQSTQYRDDPGPHVGYMSYVVRTTGDPSGIVPALRETVRALAPAVAVSDVIVMNDAVRQATSSARFVLALLGAFAGVALVLAAVGIYGVMSYLVANRRLEIGIRLALGASRARIVGRIVAEGLKVTAVGAAIGAVGAMLSGGVMSGLLFGVTALDVPAFLTAAVALAATAAIACYIPARRASRIDPARELR